MPNKVRYPETMSWRFDDIETFLDVMETGSVTATAARLNVSKSVVSKRITDLEEALGAALFQRTARAARGREPDRRGLRRAPC